MSHFDWLVRKNSKKESIQLISRLDAQNSELQVSSFFLVSFTTLSCVFSTSPPRHRKPAAHPEVPLHKALHQYITPLQIPRELKHPEVWGVHKFPLQVEQAHREGVLQKANLVKLSHMQVNCGEEGEDVSLWIIYHSNKSHNQFSIDSSYNCQQLWKNFLWHASR